MLHADTRLQPTNMHSARVTAFLPHNAPFATVITHMCSLVAPMVPATASVGIWVGFRLTPDGRGSAAIQLQVLDLC
jgi:formylmethanofuran:tetrahydromethanopterin formyltransferase